jgi:hypothetical protein
MSITDGSADVDLYERGLRLVPDLWLAVQVIMRLRERIRYPINSVGELTAGHDEAHLELDGVVLTRKHAEDYFPSAFFPIEDEDEFLRKLYAALTWGRNVHHAEAQLSAHKQHLVH